MIRICRNQPFSSNTLSLCGLSGRNISGPMRPSLAGLWCHLDSPYSWRDLNYYLHVDYSFDSVQTCWPPPLCVDPPRPPQPRGLSAFVYSIWMSDCVLLDTIAWFSLTISIDCRSKKVDGFSLVQMVVRISLYLWARPPREIYTISSWSTNILMDPKASQISLIFVCIRSPSYPSIGYCLALGEAATSEPSY